MNKTGETKARKASSFDWADPFLLHEQLSHEERLIQETAHSFAEDRLRPRVVEAYAHERTDRSIFNEMGELGLLGLTLPPEYGGAGVSNVAYGLVAREIERVELRLPQHDERAIFARHVSDLRVRK